MLNTIIDNLSRFEDLSIHIPSIIQLFILILWIFFLRVSKIKYQASVGWSLFLLLISIIAQLFTLTTIAYIVAEYSFMLLGVGIIQIVFTRDDN